MTDTEKAQWFDIMMSYTLISRGDREKVREVKRDLEVDSVMAMHTLIDRVCEALGCSVAHAVLAIAVTSKET
jgi:hypothetical protein